jgi:hypothetical protein
MSKSDVAAGKAYVSIYVKNDVSKALGKLKTELNDFGSSIVGIGAKVAGMGAAITGGMAAAVMHFADAGSALNDMSARTGIGTTALAELGYAAKMTGADMGSVERAIGKMQKNIAGVGEESGAVTAALEAIGLSSSRLAGLAPEDQFQMISEQIADIEDPARRSAAAMGIFWKSGRELLPMMENIKDLRAEARELGIAPSPESIAAADAIGDSIDRVRAVISATIFEIGAAIAPMAQDVFDGFLTVVKAVRKFATENKALIVTTAKVGAVLLVAGSAIVAIGTAFVGAGMAIGAVMSALSGIGAAAGLAMSVLSALGSLFAAIASPLGLLVAALAAGAYAWATFTESGRQAVSGLTTIISETFGGILTTVRDTFGGIVDAVKSGNLMLAGQIAMVGLRLVFAQGLDGVAKLFGETWGTLATDLLTGDFAGAWGTLGSSILDSVATLTAGIVGLFTSAADAVAKKWQETVNAISDYILQSASEGGVMGWALEQVSGVNMKEEAERSRRLEAERRARGMKPDNGGDFVDSTQFSVTDDTKAKINAVTAAIDAKLAAMTDATGQALDDKTGGRASAASAEIAALQKELDSLKAQASQEVAAMNAGSESSAGGWGSDSGGAGAKGSAASFSLAQLAGSTGRGTAEKHLSVAEKQMELQKQALVAAQQTAMAMSMFGMVHP